MEIDYLPDDADGDAIRRVAREGADLTLPMSVDFAVVFSAKDGGLKFKQLLAGDFEASLESDDGGSSWTCYCTKRMVLRYAAVIQVQRELNVLARPLGGSVDGWGTLGNSTTNSR